ncbi:factor H binding protein domain-containing protein [uncultured Cardiobacterium sp.]|uniref:factor H binding protein domain-containing protein n=1 Tax=uncultured Cardiobacterium sp. TaxID=417619 RepID=UPI00262CF5AA|nr:factor H binding protein domain-containing protein [uncultured Cardiobacterium sp.]
MQEKILLSVLTACLLAACGGSSSDNSNPQITPPPGNNTPQQPGGPQTPQQPDNPQQPQAVTKLTADYSADNDYDWGADYNGYDTFTLKVGDKPLVKEVRGEKKQTFDLTAVPLGFHTLAAESQYTGSNPEHKAEVTLRSYRGFYGGAHAYGKDGSTSPLDAGDEAYLSPTATLPANGTATYTGTVFDAHDANDAALAYRIDFGQKKGSGTVAAANGRTALTLQEADITQFSTAFGNTHGVDSGGVRSTDGSISGTYDLGIAGPNAEEIVGSLSYGATGQVPDINQVFYGKRGDITP